MNERSLFLELLDGRVSGARLELREGDAVTSMGPPNGSDPSPLPVVAVRVHRPRFFARVLAYGNLGLGEAYMDQDFEMESGTLQDFLTILLRSRIDRTVRGNPRYLLRLGAIRLRSRLRPKWRSVRRHYDLGDDLFRAFLDPTLTYSCGYALSEHDSLSDLQLNKLDRILRKLDVQPGDRLLDIGCGYGGLLVYAGQNYGVTGTGVTNSLQHAAGAAAAVAEAGLADRILVHTMDYQEVTGVYDRVVSVGMMEHVPRREYQRFFQVLSGALAPGGRGLIHTIGCNAARNRHDPFFQKYIFPASNQPRLSEITLHLERRGLPILDVENMVRHYEPTTVAWLRKYQQNCDTLDTNKYDNTFLRMWEYYLCCGIAGAVASGSALYQVLFAKDYTDPIPLHRV
jgi:cyclopropane-fatty-acyl-phospholipid synthase